MRLNIIECDILYPDLLDDYRSYGTMFERYFRQFEPALEVHYYSALEQQLPDEDTPGTFLITGSKAGVYENHAWIAPLMAWIREAHAREARILGICFGHQVLAEALGGKVTKSEKGWGVGVRELAWHGQHLLPQKERLKLIYSHQDQVQQLPQGAELMAGDDFCPHAAFHIGNRVMGFQGHPEFDAAYTRRLLPRRAADIGEPRFQQAMVSLTQATDSVELGARLIRWLLG